MITSHHQIFRPIGVVLFAILIGFVCIEPAVSDDLTVRPVDTGAALPNPGMGWVFHHYDNAIYGYGEPLGHGYDGREFPGLSVVYLRLAWSHLEPREGEFNWSILDSIIQRYARAGVRFALRLTVFEGVVDQGTPQWMRDAGCPGFMVKPYDVECWEPDYSAPFFLEKLANFLNAAGKRYANHPDLDFVDVGTLGIWGEGNPIHHKYPVSVLKQHIDLHRQAFPNALLVANDDWASTFRFPDIPESRDIPVYHDDPLVTQFVFDEGLTLRDDTINVYPDPKLNYSDYRAKDFWPIRPVILEMGHYEYAKKVGAWGGERYYQAVEDYHASYTSIHADPIVFLKENADLIHQINMRLGYRIRPVEVSFPSVVDKKEGVAIRSSWVNAGVAPCYGGGHPIWTLIDEDRNIAAVLADETFDCRELEQADDPNQLQPKEHTRHFQLSPRLKPGEYTLCVSLGNLTGQPIIAMPLPALLQQEDGMPLRLRQPDALRYPLGKIQIK